MSTVGQLNFLQLCQAVFRDGGIPGNITSVQNQVGEALRVVAWVQNSYLEILGDQGIAWNFLRGSLKTQLTVGQGTYTFADLGLPEAVQWDTRTGRVAVSDDLADETFLQHMRFPEFRDYWLFSSRRTTVSRPLNAAVDNNTNLRIAPLPDQAYWLVMDYELIPQQLALNTDIPILPPRFHNLIMWRALRHYGMFEGAPEVVARADKMVQVMMQQLENTQAYEVIVGGAIC